VKEAYIKGKKEKSYLKLEATRKGPPRCNAEEMDN
jgi:hypothetical protein